jgi:PAS domain S-box-containing protein
MQKARVLVVEDESITAQDVAAILLNLGYSVTSTVASGNKALEAVEADRPDIILMDIVLQGDLDGIATTRRIRSRFDIPIVYLTAYSDEKTLLAAKNSELFGYVLKPIDSRELQIAIEMALHEHAEQKKLERALRDSQERYRLLVDNMNEGIVLQDKSGVISYINENFLKAQGYDKEEVLGHCLSEFIEDEAEPAAEKPGGPGPEDSFRQREIKWSRKDGQKLSAIFSPRPIYDENGHLRGSVAVITDITQRRQIEEELSRSEEVLRKLSLHLQSVREKESKRIAREIHDELGQALTALKMDLAWISQKIVDKRRDPKRLLEKISSMSELMDKTLQAVQKISADLRPGLLDDLGLVPAVEWLAQEFERRSGVRCSVNLRCQNANFSPDCSTAVFRIIQEALTNVARHARATLVRIDLKESAGELELRIWDNGRGIREEEIRSPESLGLIGIRERLFPLGGVMKLEGLPDKGTTLEIKMPLKQTKSK